MVKFSGYFTAIFLSCTLLFYIAQGKVHYYDFHLTEKNFTRLCTPTPMLVVNDQVPGPTIYVNKGDTLYVNVHNHGFYGVTLHWHGVKQPRNPWSDGPEYVTQCPIQPWANFTHEVIFSDEEGTLWWHAHSGWTRVGVHGAIVIYPEEGTTYPYPITPDDEQVLVFGEWFTYDVAYLVESLDGEQVPGSDSFTINSQPGDFCPCSREDTYRWEVEYGKTYLLRMVCATMNEELFVAIAGHSMTVVGRDGGYLKPFVTDYIAIGPGETMDVLVTANQSSGGQFYMAIRSYFTGEIDFIYYDNTNVTAIMQYKGSNATSDPYFPSNLPEYNNLFDGVSFRSNFRSLQPRNVPKNITSQMYTTVALNEDPDGILYSSMNNISWTDPEVDVLQAYYYNLSGFYTEDFPDRPLTFYDFVELDVGMVNVMAAHGTKVKVFELGEEVEMVFQASNFLNGSMNHPMHLHGHSYYVVGTGMGNFNFTEDPKYYNLVDPPQLNTAVVPKQGWLTIRFKANNPGVWLWHCHLDRHLTWGMNYVIIVKNGATPETSIREPPSNMPSCIQNSISNYLRSRRSSTRNSKAI